MNDVVTRCQALVAEIGAIAEATGAYEAQREWIAMDGTPVYNTPITPDYVTSEFLAELPRHAPFFTGSPPEGATPTRFGALLCRLPAPLAGRLFARYWHRLQRAPHYFAGLPLDAARRLADWYLGRLPQVVQAAAACDGTELDRLALCERLYAMHTLGVFAALGAIRRPAIVEIGAGYGMVAAALLRAFPRASYRIVDLPNSLALAGCYLTSRRIEGVELVVSTQLSRLEGRPIDLAINTLSFGEMSAETVDRYAAFIARNLAPSGQLFEQNFDNARLHGTFCDPASVLARHLACTATARGFWLKGTPRIWRS